MTQQKIVVITKQQAKLKKSKIKDMISANLLALKCERANNEKFSSKYEQRSDLHEDKDKDEISQKIHLMCEISQKISQQILTRQFSFNHYILCQKLGEGSQGMVYKCIKKSTNQILAVKITKLNQQKVFILQKAYKALKKIENEFIIKVKQYYVDQSSFTGYLLQEYCHYPTLREYMSSTQYQQLKMMEKQLKIGQIVKKILSALTYLHQKGIAHRDLKPQNILYNSQTQQIKIIDFETVYISAQQNQPLDMWSQTGTMAYRAPQSFQVGYSQLVDIWSVGIIAYQMAFDKLPFWSQFTNSLIQKIKEEQIQISTKTCSFRLKQFITKLLQKIPTRRLTAKEALRTTFIIYIDGSETQTNDSPTIYSNVSNDYFATNAWSESEKIAQKLFNYSFIPLGKSSSTLY